jgi:hypothetical protein
MALPATDVVAELDVHHRFCGSGINRITRRTITNGAKKEC